MTQTTRQLPQRSARAGEGVAKSLLASAEVMYDFDNTHLDDLPEVAPNVKVDSSH